MNRNVSSAAINVLCMQNHRTNTSKCRSDAIYHRIYSQRERRLMHACLYSRDANDIFPRGKSSRENVNDVYRAQSNGQTRPLMERKEVSHRALKRDCTNCRRSEKSKYLF